ncbi:MAG: hypothetical protein ACM3OC_09905 [Deltaproteobacteria bacterium]
MADDRPAVQWYFKTSILVFALLSVGPVALPLLWFNPRFTPARKALVTLIVLAASYLLMVFLTEAQRMLQEQLKLLSG